MLRLLEKYLYTTTYKQDYCPNHQLPRDEGATCHACSGQAHDSHPGYSGEGKCNKAKKRDFLSNLDDLCTCLLCGKYCGTPPVEQPCETNLMQNYCMEPQPPPACAPPQPPANEEYNFNNMITTKIMVSSQTSIPKSPKAQPACPRVKLLRPAARGKFGGQFEGVLNMPAGDARGNGPPWLNRRRDERRDPDVLRLMRHHPRGEIRDVVHGEEGRANRRLSLDSQQPRGRGRPIGSGSNVRIPGPFWIRQRPDERREIDALRRKKFNVPTRVGGIIRGEDTGGPFRPGRRPSSTSSQGSGPFWHRRRGDERREVDVPRRRKFSSFSEAKEVIHGGGGSREGGRRRHPHDIPKYCRPRSGPHSAGPFWQNPRPDERREPDIDRRRKFERRDEVPDVIHGEEARERRRSEIDPYDLPPGPSHVDPFWMLERQDERRDPDMDRRRKFRRQKIEAAEIVQGEDFRTRWDPPEPQSMVSSMGIVYSEDEDEDDSEPFPFRRSCQCGPAPMQRGYDSWSEQGTSVMGEEEDFSLNIFEDADEEVDAMHEPPAARVSCAPQSDVANYDQPNAFMRKLYEKYPYLYNVLRDTPQEELMSKVFKDRFMSTYQVDYLHMGGGADQAQNEIPQDEAQRFTGPDGEPEPEAIPGCSYRASQKGDFGRKKQDKPEKKEKEEEAAAPVQEEPEGPPVSEYMATISRLGQDIVQDQLYKVAKITKGMKNQYKKM